MLRSIQITTRIAFYSRVAVINASNHRQFSTKYGHTTRADEWQRQIEIEEKKGRNTIRLRENLCNAYITEKNVEKVEELMKTCNFSDFIHHNIISMHIDMGSTELALIHLAQIRKARPNFKLTRKEAARLARAMFKEEREWADIIRIFIENKPQRMEGRNVLDINLLLQTVAESGNPTEMNELFDTLVENNFAVKDSQAAGYLVKVHLVNNDLSAAMRTFEKQFEEKQFISNHMPLMMAFIVANDIEKLQKVFRLMQSKYSEADAVLSLITSYIRIGNIDLARVLLEHHMPRISDYTFRKYYERYHNYGEYTVLEGLLAATVGLEYDRSVIYTYLLVEFCAQNNTRAAVELWHRQRDNQEESSRNFMQTLSSYLKDNGFKVPFHVPEVIALLPPHLSPEGIAEMKTALQLEDADGALASWSKINVNSTHYSHLSSDLVRLLSKSKSNHNTEAVDVTIKSIEMDRRVSDESLRELVQRLADDGDLQSLEQLYDALPRTTKRSIQFNPELLAAYERSGKWNDFFRIILRKVNYGMYVADRIPKLPLLKLLQKGSIPLKEFEKFAESMAEASICGPLNVLWAHYFLINPPRSNRLYERLEEYYSTRFEMAFLASFLAGAEEDGKLEELQEFARANSEKHLPAINVVALVIRMTKSSKMP